MMLQQRIFYLLIFISLVFGQNLSDYISDDPTTQNAINSKKGLWQSGNTDELLKWTTDVLERTPLLIEVHLLRGRVFFHRLAEIEQALYHYKMVREYCDKLQAMPEYKDKLKRTIDRISYETNRAISEIEYNYGDLKFKIRGKTIEKFCYVKNMSVLISWDIRVLKSAENHQKIRFNRLKETLASGEKKFMFADFDTTDGRIYFKVKYFPLVSSGIPEPYHMIINNEKRYHFNFDNQSRSVIEIDWNDDWQLVEAVPPEYSKVEFDKSVTVKLAGLPFGSAKILTAPNKDAMLKNIYIPIESDQNFVLAVEYAENKRKMESALYWFNRGVLFSTMIAIMLLAR